MTEGYISTSVVNACGECFGMPIDLQNDTEGMISDADPGL
jgi:hypothetical protein